MMCALQLRRVGVVLVLGLLLAGGSFAGSPESLTWNTNRNRVSADIQSGRLLDVLERVAARTGWQIFLEPGTTHSVSTKFKELPPGEALRLLLGDVNFALIPMTNGSSKLLVFRTDSQHATQPVTAAEPSRSALKVIANELIVRLKPGANIDEIARLLGATVVGRMDKLNAYRLRFADEKAANAARAQLAEMPEIAAVDSNFSIDRLPTPREMTANAIVPQLQMRPPPETGRVIIGLVDTGVQPLGNNLDQFIQPQISVAGGSRFDANIPSHGTAMAETMLRSLQQVTGGTTSVQILPIDVYGAGESTSTFDVANGIIQAVNGGARIINLSLGSPGDSPFLRDVVRRASAANILLIGAAGNVPVTTPFYPAAYPEVRAVTAIDNGEIAPYASRGSYVSLGAPGANLVPFANQYFGVQGTSVSSAIIAGAAAGYMDANRASTAQAQGFLQTNFGLGGSH